MMHMRRLFLILVIGLLLGGIAMADSGNLPAGTPISVEISAPPDGALRGYPTGEIQMSGTASIGEGLPVANTLIVYVIDVSGSTLDPAGCGGNQNGDGFTDSILDCEILATKNLNGIAQSTGTVREVGVAVFATGAAAADVAPETGAQLVTGPATDAGGAPGPDVEQVMSSAVSAGVTQFTAYSFEVQTNFAAGLTAAFQVVAASTAPEKMIVFMSDGGQDSVMLGDLSTAPSDNTVLIKAFAVGPSSSCSFGTGSTPGSLDDVADRGSPESDCTPVPDISQLPNVIPGVLDSKLTDLEYNVDAGTWDDLAGVSPALPWTGPKSGTFGPQDITLVPGTPLLCARAIGEDMGGPGEVTDCITLTVATIDLTPETASNELGTPGQEHTVTATVAAGIDGGVPGVAITFEILSGPNAGGTGDGTTDASGQAPFTYAAIQGLAGLGTDGIEACFIDDFGNEICDTATKEWVDTTPPVGACGPGPNPAGKVPPAKGGQRPDGFYALTATDAVDPSPLIYVVDTGSGTVFGPFTSVTNIKYTQAPGATPDQKPMSGVVSWHITGTGDAAVYAVDAMGNVQDPPVSCLVPPPPK